eukprot:PhM_4_TR11651/c0_g1_i2/m.4702
MSDNIERINKLASLQAFSNQLRTLRERLNATPPLNGQQTNTNGVGNKSTSNASSAQSSPRGSPAIAMFNSSAVTSQPTNHYQHYRPTPQRIAPPPPTATTTPSNQYYFQQQQHHQLLPESHVEVSYLEAQLMSKNNTIQDLQNEISSLQLDIGKAQSVIKEAKEENRQLRSQNEDLEQSMASVEQQVNGIFSQRESEHKAESARLRNDLEAARRETEELRRELEMKNDEVAEQRSSLSRSKSTEDSTSFALTELTKRHKALNEEMTSMSQTVIGLQRERAEMELEFGKKTKKWREEMDALHESEATAVREVSLLKSTLSKTSDRVQELEAKASTLVKELEETTNDKKKLTESISDLQRAIERGNVAAEMMESQVHSSEKEVQALRNENASLKSDLDDVLT